MGLGAACQEWFLFHASSKPTVCSPPALEFKSNMRLPSEKLLTGKNIKKGWFLKWTNKPKPTHGILHDFTEARIKSWTTWSSKEHAAPPFRKLRVPGKYGTSPEKKCQRHKRREQKTTAEQRGRHHLKHLTNCSTSDKIVLGDKHGA